MANLSLVAVGDIILEPETHSQTFEHIKHVLRGGDITFGNVDQACSDLGSDPSGFWPIYAGAPPHSEAFLDSLKDAGFDVLGYGNNHALDWGYDAFLDTLVQCRKRGLEPIGGGANLAEARTPAIVNRNGTSVGFLSYCSIGFDGYEAEQNRPGHVPMRAHTHYEQ